MAGTRLLVLLVFGFALRGVLGDHPTLVSTCEALRQAVSAASALHDGTHPTVILTSSISCSNVHLEYPLTLLGGFDASGHSIVLSRRTIDQPTLIVDSKDVTIRSVSFVDAGGVGGGAVLVSSNASAVLQDLTFHNSAFGIWPALTIEGKAEVTGSIFEDCHSSGPGGGAAVRASGYARFKDCTFSRNAANVGAGVAVDGLAHFCSTSFNGNKAKHGPNVWVRGSEQHAGAQATFCSDMQASGSRASPLFAGADHAGVGSETDRGHITRESCDACSAPFVKSVALFESRRRARVPLLAFLSQANLTDHELGRKAIRPETDDIYALTCPLGSFALDGVCEPDCLPQTTAPSTSTWRLLDLTSSHQHTYTVRFDNNCGKAIEALAFDCDDFEGSLWGLERHGSYCVLTGHEDVPAGHSHEFHYSSAAPFAFRPHSAHTHQSSTVRLNQDGIEITSKIIQTWREAGSQELLSRVEVNVTNLSAGRVSLLALDCHVFDPEWSFAVDRKEGRCILPKGLEPDETHSFEYIMHGVRTYELSVLEVRGVYGEVVKGANILSNMYTTVGVMCVLVLVASASVGWYALGPNKDRRAAVYTRILTRERTFRMSQE